MDTRDSRFAAWMTDLEARHLADLTFPEVSRSLRALSSTYVERRRKLREGAALTGVGKRAAFALFYGPLHFLLVGHIVRSLPDARVSGETLIDLGCGTGAAGAACATAGAKTPAVLGIDGHPWAAEEARRTYRAFGLRGRAQTGDAVRVPYSVRSTVLAAFMVNELEATARDALLARLLTHASQDGRVLVVEPLAKFVVPWWSVWQQAFEAAGGRADEWRVRMPLPAIVEKLDRASGLNHRELTGRSLLA
jgi:SAM-dependent methyltransferase